MQNDKVFIPAFVRLLTTTGETRYVRTDDIEQMTVVDSGTKIHLGDDDPLTVVHSPDAVQALIIDAYIQVYSKFTDAMTKKAMELQMSLSQNPGPGGPQA